MNCESGFEPKNSRIDETNGFGFTKTLTRKYFCSQIVMRSEPVGKLFPTDFPGLYIEMRRLRRDRVRQLFHLRAVVQVLFVRIPVRAEGLPSKALGVVVELRIRHRIRCDLMTRI